LNKVINKVTKYLINIFAGILIFWVLYMFTMAGWNTFCKGCPVKWYTTNVEPYIPRPEPKPKPPIIEDDEEDWEDSEWE
jgi:hypothetical protein|tara:strand:- start:1912 stop:2148 length:237 start_codon:yes stop_codon:yes gene_type:complete